MERTILGDNQFFGVNHLSEDKARAQAMRFQDTAEIVRVLDLAYDSGIRAFMCTTHERVAEICGHVRAHPDRYRNFAFYPSMPYAHKYANAVTEHGIAEAIGMLLPSSGALGAALRGGVSLARRDLNSLGRMLIDAEMKMFDGLETPIIFLQNVVTDLLLGIGAIEAFSIFAEHVRARYGAEPGFITMNAPFLLPVLERAGLDNPIVCANVNKVGFRMSGGAQVYENLVRTRRFRPIAMSVFASGKIPPRDAIGYVAGLDNIEAVVFGASSRANIVETTSLIDELFGERDARRSIGVPVAAERGALTV